MIGPVEKPQGYSDVVYYDDSVHIIYEACKSCYGITDDNKSYEEIKGYIGRRVAAGHNSILEHSNIIIGIFDVSTPDYGADLIRLTTSKRNLCKYLKVRSNLADKNGETGKTYDVIIQGSVRGFKHLIERFPWNEEENILIQHIRKQLYLCTVKEYWLDVSEDIIDPTQFVDDLLMAQLDPENPIDDYYSDFIDPGDSFTMGYNKNDKIEIVNIDRVDAIKTALKSLDSEDEEFADDEEIRELSTITVLFKNMSRTATHQLVRHRNAITQESQRYVNYDNAGFTLPPVAKYLPDEDMFEIELNGSKKKYTLESLGKELCNIYGQLRKQGVKKEDARAYLPGNVQCRKIYMTFTISSLFKFFELRCETHAQAEIRSFAWELFRTLRKLQKMETKIPYTEEFKQEYDVVQLRSPYWIPGIEDLYNSILVKWDDEVQLTEGETE